MSPSHNVSSCFRPSAADDHSLAPPLPPLPVPGDPNPTTCLYQTHLGLFSLMWSRTFFGYSLRLHLHSQDYCCLSSPLSFSPNTSLCPASAFSFHLNIKPFAFWRKFGSKKIPAINNSTKIQVFWDLIRVKFGSGPEPRSGFYIAVVVDGEMCLLVGDCSKEAYVRSGATTQRVPQALVLRREHVFGHSVFCTKARFGGKNREICMDCRVAEDARLCFSVDRKKVLQIKRLKWKFRGNEKIEVDGVPIQISWDVYNWLFDSKAANRNNDGHAVFMFRYENQELQEEGEEEREGKSSAPIKVEEGKNGAVPWQQNSCGFGVAWRNTRRRFLMSARSSSSISMSSASSACSSSVMEWASSADESELGGTAAAGGGGLGFSLLVYAWRS